MNVEKLFLYLSNCYFAIWRFAIRSLRDFAAKSHNGNFPFYLKKFTCVSAATVFVIILFIHLRCLLSRNPSRCSIPTQHVSTSMSINTIYLKPHLKRWEKISQIILQLKYNKLIKCLLVLIIFRFFFFFHFFLDYCVASDRVRSQRIFQNSIGQHER